MNEVTELHLRTGLVVQDPNSCIASLTFGMRHFAIFSLALFWLDFATMAPVWFMDHGTAPRPTAREIICDSINWTQVGINSKFIICNEKSHHTSHVKLARTPQHVNSSQCASAK